MIFSEDRCTLPDHALARSSKPPLLIATEGHMVRMQVSAETSAWLSQAQDLLDEARRLRPGQARNELRQVAKAMRELAKLDAKSEPEPGFDQPKKI
jgi:hypothetical protein